MNLTPNDILRAFEGRNEEGEPNALASLSLKIYKKDVGVTVPKSRLILDTASVTIHPAGSVVKVMLHFPFSSSPQLRLMWSTVTLYFSSLAKVSEESNDVPVLFLDITSKVFNWKYFASGTVPVCASLEAEKPNEFPSAISLIYDAEDFALYESDEIDEAEIDAELMRAKYEQERIDTEADRVRALQRENEKRRNDKLRQLRYRQ